MELLDFLTGFLVGFDVAVLIFSYYHLRRIETLLKTLLDNRES
jgi:hypothetical protein